VTYLGNTVVDVDGWYKKLLVFRAVNHVTLSLNRGLMLTFQHLVKVVNTSGGFLRDTIASLKHLWVFLVDKRSQVSSIIKNQVERLAILECDQLLFKAPLVFLLGLTFPGKDRDTSSSNCSSSMILGREDVA
jgi:hypothetical protein